MGSLRRWGRKLFWGCDGERCFGWNVGVLVVDDWLRWGGRRWWTQEEYERMSEEGRVK